MRDEQPGAGRVWTDEELDDDLRALASRLSVASSPGGLESAFRRMQESLHGEAAQPNSFDEPATSSRHPRRWLRPVLVAAAAVAVLLAGGVIALELNKPLEKAQPGPGAFTVLDRGVADRQCDNRTMSPTVSVPDSDVPGAHLEAGLVDSGLCIVTSGPNARGGEMVLERRPGPVPYFSGEGFPEALDDSGTVTVGWFLYGAADSSVDAIRFTSTEVRTVTIVSNVAALGDLRVFALNYPAAGTLEFLSGGEVVATEELQDRPESAPQGGADPVTGEATEASVKLADAIHSVQAEFPDDYAYAYGDFSGHGPVITIGFKGSGPSGAKEILDATGVQVVIVEHLGFNELEYLKTLDDFVEQIRPLDFANENINVEMGPAPQKKPGSLQIRISVADGYSFDGVLPDVNLPPPFSMLIATS